MQFRLLDSQDLFYVENKNIAIHSVGRFKYELTVHVCAYNITDELPYTRIF